MLSPITNQSFFGKSWAGSTWIILAIFDISDFMYLPKNSYYRYNWWLNLSAIPLPTNIDKYQRQEFTSWDKQGYLRDGNYLLSIYFRENILPHVQYRFQNTDPLMTQYRKCKYDCIPSNDVGDMVDICTYLYQGVTSLSA